MKKKSQNIAKKHRRNSGKAAMPLVVAIGVTTVLGPVIGVEGAFLVGMSLGYILFPRDNKTEMPEVSTFPVQRSDKGTPIQIVLGTRKVAGNVIWLDDMHPYTVKTGGGGDGKGFGGSSQPESFEIRYRRSFLICICHGTAHIRRVWAGKEEIDISFLTELDGSDNDGLTTALTGEDYGEYRYMLLAHFNEFELGPSTSLPNFTFEVTSSPVSYLTGIFGGNGHLYGSDQNHELISDIALPIGSMGAAVDTSGRKIYGVGAHTSSNSTSPIRVYNNNLTELLITQDFFNWGVLAGNSVCTTHSLVVSADGTKVVTALEFITELNQLTCWSLITGEIIWTKVLPVGNFQNISIDQYDNIITRAGVVDGFGRRYAWFHAMEDGTQFKESRGINADLSFYFPGSSNHEEAMYYIGGNTWAFWSENVYKSKTATGPGSGVAIDVLADASYSMQLGPSVSVRALLVTEDGVYVAGNTYLASDGTILWKLDHDLTEVTAAETVAFLPASSFQTLHQLANGNILVGIGGTGEDPTAYNVIEYTPDLVRVKGVDWGVSGLFASPDSMAVPSALVSGAVIDVNPVDVIQALLTNTRYGSKINASLHIDSDSFQTARDYCNVNDLLFSFVFTTRKPVVDHMDYVLSHFQGYVFMSEGKINIGVYKEQISTFDIDRNDLSIDTTEEPEPPVKIVKRKYSETNNRIELTWTNRDKEYDTSVAVANDEVDQRQSGDVRIKTLNLRGITNADLAQMLAYRYLNESMYRFSVYNFILSYKNMLLETGDVGTFNDGFTISDAHVRITSVEEDKDGRGFAVQAVEDGTYLYSIVKGDYATEDTNHVEVPLPAADELVAPEITFLQSRISNKISLSFAPVASEVNGWDWYLSFDDVSYTHQARVNSGEVTDGWNVTGELVGVTPEYPSVIHRANDSFEVLLGSSVGNLDTTITDDEFFSEQKLCKLGNEIIAYRDIEDVSESVSSEHIEGIDLHAVLAGSNIILAQKWIMTQDMVIDSVSVYHQTGAVSNVVVGIYDDNSGSPDNRIAVSGDLPIILGSTDWHTYMLTTPVSVTLGQTIYIASNFQLNIIMRKSAGIGVGVNYVVGSNWADRLPASMPATATVADEHVFRIGGTITRAYTNKFRISNLIRGMYGTKAIAHSPSDVFATLDTDAVMEFTTLDVGRKFYIKAATFYGTKQMDIADVTATSDIIRGYLSRPAPASMLRLTDDISDRVDDRYIGSEFDLNWSNNDKFTGFNRGGYDIHSDITTGIWQFDDDEALLKSGNGVLYGAFSEDTELQGLNLRFETEAGGLVFDSDINVAETRTITKATDLGGSDVVVAILTTKRSLLTLRTNEITITGD